MNDDEFPDFVTVLEGQTADEAQAAWQRMTAGLERLPPVVLPLSWCLEEH